MITHPMSTDPRDARTPDRHARQVRRAELHTSNSTTYAAAVRAVAFRADRALENYTATTKTAA